MNRTYYQHRYYRKNQEKLNKRAKARYRRIVTAKFYTTNGNEDLLQGPQAQKPASEGR